MLLRTPKQALRTSLIVIGATGQRYRQATQSLYLGGLVNESANVFPEINRRPRLLAWPCHKRLTRELYDTEVAPFTLNARMLKAEVSEALLYGRVTWTLGKQQFAELRHTTGF